MFKQKTARASLYSLRLENIILKHQNQYAIIARAGTVTFPVLSVPQK
jgi:hypothetical protein